ncbi:hypothetical protein AAH248_001176 [Klebsiella michiganensis]
MRWMILACFFITPLTAIASTGASKEDIKQALERYAGIDAVDWYSKGDTVFAENDGFIGIYRQIKASVRDNEVNLKIDFKSGPKYPDKNEFSRITSEVCLNVFSSLIMDPDTSNDAPVSWENDENNSTSTKNANMFIFMDGSNLDKVYGKTITKKVNGWSVSIKRNILLTTCTAKKD